MRAGIFIRAGGIMTDIGRLAHVTPARTQLPVNAYFDQERFQLEMARIFNRSSRYVGHEKLVPEVGDWRTLVQEDAGRVLVRNANGIELVSNVCRHRQSIMLGGAPGNVAGNVNTSGSARSLMSRMVAA